MKKLLITTFILSSLLAPLSIGQAASACAFGEISNPQSDGTTICSRSDGSNYTVSSGGQVTQTTGTNGAQPSTPSTATTNAAAQTQSATPGTCANGLAPAPGKGCNLGYTPLEPIPGITSGDTTGAIDFPTMLGRIYTIAIIIGALFSVLMLTISGIRYMLSDIVTSKEKARDRIKACIYGLVLIAASYLILNTINPQLVKFTLQPGSGTVSSGNTVTPSSPNGQTAQQQALTSTQDKISNTAAGQAAFTPSECAAAKSNYDSFLAQWQGLSARDRYSASSDQAKDIKAGMLNANIITDACSK